MSLAGIQFKASETAKTTSRLRGTYQHCLAANPNLLQQHLNILSTLFFSFLIKFPDFFKGSEEGRLQTFKNKSKEVRRQRLSLSQSQHFQKLQLQNNSRPPIFSQKETCLDRNTQS